MLVLSAGFQTTVQDCGRFGFRKFGVGTAGALDSATLRTLNLLVGNDECAAGLEISSGRVGLKFSEERLIAWGGGDFDVRIEGHVIPPHRVARVSANVTCEILPKRGRAWLTVSGGIAVPELLASRSTDLRAKFGGWKGRALSDGDELPLRAPSAQAIAIAQRMKGEIADWSGPRFSPLPVSSLRIIPGNNWEEGAGAKFIATDFRVAMNSDRMGLRLESGGIRFADARELLSAAVAPGTIQLPPDGAPILLLADCQTTGGYPKLAHVITVDLARAAQLQPMDGIRFELTTLDRARRLLAERERDIALFRAGLEARFG